MSAKTLTQDVIPGILTGGIYNVGKAGFNILSAPARNALKAQQALEAQRRTELETQASQRDTDAQVAAKRGQTFGSRQAFIGDFGFGSGNSKTGLGFGDLLGGA